MSGVNKNEKMKGNGVVAKLLFLISVATPILGHGREVPS